jgi:hypothetical protein
MSEIDLAPASWITGILMKSPTRPSPIPADPEQWSEKSKQSIAYDFVREYRDIHYRCWCCQASCIFTAQDQKHAYEVKKASKDQKRRLCEGCWLESNRIRAQLDDCASSWAASKQERRHDEVFLANWLALLVRLDTYGYKPDSAKKSMLKKLLSTINSSPHPAEAGGGK